MPLLLAAPVLSFRTNAHSLTDSGGSLGTIASTDPARLDLTYSRPAQTTNLRNYVFEASPIPSRVLRLRLALAKRTTSLPEWKQGAKEDTLHYRCECKGVFSRLRHAVISTLSARRGDQAKPYERPAVRVGVMPHSLSITRDEVLLEKCFKGVQKRTAIRTLNGYCDHTLSAGNAVMG
jgi:hypothetical protein